MAATEVTTVGCTVAVGGAAPLAAAAATTAGEAPAGVPPGDADRIRGPAG